MQVVTNIVLAKEPPDQFRYLDTKLFAKNIMITGSSDHHIQFWHRSEVSLN